MGPNHVVFWPTVKGDIPDRKRTATWKDQKVFLRSGVRKGQIRPNWSKHVFGTNRPQSLCHSIGKLMRGASGGLGESKIDLKIESRSSVANAFKSAQDRASRIADSLLATIIRAQSSCHGTVSMNSILAMCCLVANHAGSTTGSKSPLFRPPNIVNIGGCIESLFSKTSKACFR